MNIGLNITRYFVKYAYVLLESIIENNKQEEIHLFIFSTNIEESDLYFMRELMEKHNGTIDLISIDIERIKEVFIKPCALPLELHTHYFQIHTLPDGIDRILIMDGDMIVKKSLKEFYEMDFGDNYVICLDGACINHELNDFYDRFVEMGVTPFSTVFALYNVKKIKEDFSFEDILQANNTVLATFNYSNEEFGFGILFNGKEVYVPEMKYGFYISPQNEKKHSGEELSKYEEEAVAIHYFQCHPWEPKIGMLPMHSYWWEYAKNTPYYEELKADFWTYWKSFRSKLLTDMAVSVLFEYKFPWSQIEAGSKIMIYGAGDVGKSQIRQMRLTEYSCVKAVIDKRAARLGDAVEGIPVISMENLKEIYHGEKIVIGILREEIRLDIKASLIQMGIPRENIVWNYEVRNKSL